MKILVVGSGGREHALCWKLKQSPQVEKVYCAPGNGGTRLVAENVPISEKQISELVKFVQQEQIDLTVVGPEEPLAHGIVDQFRAQGLKIFGPTKAAAIIEGSKAFAKDLMARYKIPTADYRVFSNAKEALAYLNEIGVPIVIKADGLAAGKGVVVAFNMDDAVAAVNQVFSSGTHQKVVIEEYLEGEELSLMAFVDGETVIPMPLAQDHKQAFDGDLGPNTGGMGAYSPVPHFSQAFIDQAVEQVLKPTAKAMLAENRAFTGVLYAGLMITEKGLKVIEFNARFGDPETQVILPRLAGDLVDILLACVNHQLDQIEINWNEQAALTVVLASPGYPGPYPTGNEITGLEALAKFDDLEVFHAGTVYDGNCIKTAGGRVLAVTGLADSLEQAQNRAYQGIHHLNFYGMHYRSDIGNKAINQRIS